MTVKEENAQIEEYITKIVEMIQKEENSDSRKWILAMFNFIAIAHKVSGKSHQDFVNFVVQGAEFLKVLWEEPKEEN